MASTTVPTTSLNADEADALHLIGISLIEDIYSVVLETVYWTVNAILFSTAVYILISRGRKNWSTACMLAAVFILFGSCSSIYGLEVGLMLVRYKIRLVSHPDWAITERNAYVKSHFKEFGLGMETLWMLNMIIGDAVVIWRAWILWPGRRIVLLLPLIFLAGTFSFAVLAIWCLAEDSFNSLSRVVGSSSRTCSWAEPIAWAMSLCTNIVATSLIAVKAWQHRQLLKRHFEVQPRKSQAQKALMLLIESGSLYCVLFLLQIVGFFTFTRTDSRFYLYGAIEPFGEQLSGIYPTAIIVIVALQQTVHAHTTYHEHTGGPTIEFAPSPARSNLATTKDTFPSPSEDRTDRTSTSGTYPVSFKDELPVFAERSSVGKIAAVEPDLSIIPLKRLGSRSSQM
ncbi:hypothetical protein DL96DRAFT_1706014 [Flagelloscypha sp. PMI_526]|nr:hypothetical protein DL96DRAFT_1706014 [Flagelloscypha sp. PMI_526]